jgi:hypothetical protein
MDMFSAGKKLLLKIKETQKKIADLATKLVFGSVNENFVVNFASICPCIESISLKCNQQDATFSRSIYFHKLLYMF